MSGATSTSPDVVAIVTNLGIFCTAIAATIAGIWKGIQNIKKQTLEPVAGAKIASAVVLEAAALNEWTTAIHGLCKSNAELCKSNLAMKDSLEEHREQMRELRHQIELSRIARTQQ